MPSLTVQVAVKKEQVYVFNKPYLQIHTRRFEKFNTLNQTQFSFSGYLGTPVQFIFHTCRSSLLVQQQKLDRGHIYSLIFTPSPGLLLLVYLSGFTLQTTTYLTLLSLKLNTSTFFPFYSRTMVRRKHKLLTLPNLKKVEFDQIYIRYSQGSSNFDI